MVVNREDANRGQIVTRSLDAHNRVPFFLRNMPEAPASRRLVRDGGGNAQLHFRAGSQFAPEIHVPADAPGTLAHPGQAPVSGAPFVTKDARVNAASIIPDPYPKLPFV